MAERHLCLAERSHYWPPRAPQPTNRANQKFATQATLRSRSGQEGRDGIRSEPSYDAGPRPDYRCAEPFRSGDPNSLVVPRPLRAEVPRSAHRRSGSGR